MASFLGTKRIWREVFTVEKAVLKTNPIRSYKTGSLLLLQTVLANLDGGGELVERARARVELLLHRRVPEKTTTSFKTRTGVFTPFKYSETVLGRAGASVLPVHRRVREEAL